MTTRITGFVSIPSLADNSSKKIATLGELSSDAETFAREKQFTAIDAAPGIELIIFDAEDDNKIKISGITGPQTAPFLKLIHDIKTEYKGSGTLADWFTAKNYTDLTAFSYGDVILQDGIHLPRHLKVTQTGDNAFEFDVWLSNETFESDYPLSETYALSPIADPSKYFNDYDIMKPFHDASSYTEKISRFNKLPPYTEVNTYILRWNDPKNLSKQITTEWTIIGHGRNSLRTDKALEAIRKTVLASSDHTIEEWRTYFPDIQTLDVFHLIPFWDTVAITAGPGVTSMHNPTLAVKGIVGPISSVMVGMPSAEIEDRAEVFPILFRNIPVGAIAGDGNLPDRRSFKAMYPDYTLMTINAPNASRLDPKTLAVISAIDQLARRAEVDTGSETLPEGVARNRINDRDFLELAANEVVYRMVTRKSYLENA